jgi:MerR HTH family regulatory protein
MSVLAIGPLPDELKEWRGTAAEMADKLREVLPLVGLQDDIEAATERLVRYYVTVGVLHAPSREGREALFDVSHIGRYLGARKLLRDGWKLPKIAEMLQSSAMATSATGSRSYGVRESAPATPAMRALQRIRQGQAAGEAPSTAATVGSSLLSNVLASRSPQELKQVASAWAASTTLQTTTQAALLTELGNPEGRAGRRRLTELALTPWCTVLLDAEAFAQLPADTADKLGLALAQALRKERTRKGD